MNGQWTWKEGAGDQGGQSCFLHVQTPRDLELLRTDSTSSAMSLEYGRKGGHPQGDLQKLSPESTTVKHSQPLQGLQSGSTIREGNVFINYGPRGTMAIGLWMSGNSAIGRSRELAQKPNWRNCSVLTEMATSGACENLTSSASRGISLIHQRFVKALLGNWILFFF